MSLWSAKKHFDTKTFKPQKPFVFVFILLVLNCENKLTCLSGPWPNIKSI